MKQLEYRENGKCGICDFEGSIKINALYDELGNCQNGMYITTSRPDDHSHYNGLILSDGREVLPMEYERFSWLEDDILLLVNANGCTVVKYTKK